MDWKDILSQKIDSGELQREEFIPGPSEAKPETSSCIQVVLDKKGRKGKSATIAIGFTCDDSRLKKIASELKTKLSTGGSARGGEILIQGDRRKEVAESLRAMGFKVK